MSDYGDYEPEDAWHPDDSVGEQVKNLRARFAKMGFQTPRIQVNAVGASAAVLRNELSDMADTVRRAGSQRVRLQSAERSRILELIEDIEFVHARLED